MSATGLLLVLIFVLLLAALVVLFVPHPRSFTGARGPADRDISAPLYRDDDRYWYGGVVYYNPDDPDPVVPKRYGFGWTVNFGHPLGKVFLLIMIGMVLLPVVLAIVAPGLNSTSGCHPSGCHLFP